jgi:hypothetical protein
MLKRKVFIQFIDFLLLLEQRRHLEAVLAL